MPLLHGVLCGLLITAGSAPAPAQTADSASGWVFVSLLRDKRIVSFSRDAMSGRLTRRSQTECPAEPAYLAATLDQKFVLVSLRSTGQLASYCIDPVTGALSLQSLVEGGDDPAYLKVDPGGQFLLTAYYAGNKVTVHRLDPQGRISEHPVQAVATAEKAHGIGFLPSGRQLFVPHTGANRIFQFHMDPEHGHLRPADPPFISTPAHHHPRHLVVHPGGRWAFVSNEADDSLSVFEIDAQGTLRLRDTLTTLPPGFDGKQNSTSRCDITPDGRYVYVANRGHDSLACFSVDSTAGTVTAAGRFATEQTPRSFTLTSDGRFLYVAGEASGRVAAFRIADDGSLHSVHTVDAGPVAWAVLSVDPATD